MMRGVTQRLVFIAAAALAIAGGGTAQAGIRWETKLDRASAEARRTNQPMLIEFWAVWCEVCKDMDRDVYADERVGAAMRKVRPVRVDIDREPDVARRYDITGTPTLVLTDSGGTELFRYAGALPLDRMLDLLDALPADVSMFNALSARLAGNKDDFAALAGLGHALRHAGFYRTSSQYYARALRTREGRRADDTRADVLLGLGRNALELRLFGEAARTLQQALREFRGRDWEPGGLLDLARALEGQDKPKDARRVLEDVMARYPGSAAAAEAARRLEGGSVVETPRRYGPASGPSMGRVSYARPARPHQYSHARSKVNELRVARIALTSPSLRKVMAPSAAARACSPAFSSR
jgi:thioredoxin-like negative regulator of GroEL